MTRAALDGGVDLDAPAHYKRVDRSDALADVEASPDQWERARELPLDVDLTLAEHVCIVGMGASAMAGHLLRSLVADRLQVPLVVHSGYGLPAFVGPSTQVIALSHSGDTEETLDAVAQARDRDAPVAAVTSGGALAELAEAHGWPVARIPPRPLARHSLGWMLVPLLAPFGIDGQIDAAVAAQRRVIAAWGRDTPRSDNLAKQFGERLAQTGLAVVWGTQGLGGAAAKRLASQLNINAKLPSYPAALPEADHHAIAGHSLAQWSPRSALIVVRDPATEHESVAKRITPIRDLVRQHFAWTAELAPDDGPPLARVAELVAGMDLISVYTALARGVDPTPVEAIDGLRSVQA